MLKVQAPRKHESPGDESSLVFCEQDNFPQEFGHVLESSSKENGSELIEVHGWNSKCCLLACHVRMSVMRERNFPHLSKLFCHVVEQFQYIPLVVSLSFTIIQARPALKALFVVVKCLPRLWLEFITWKRESV